MQKIQVMQICNQLGIGGAEKTLQILSQYLNREVFEVVICGIQSGGMREEILRKKGFETHILNGDFSKLRRLIKERGVNILHLHRGGSTEFPVLKIAREAGVPAVVETNVFGYSAPTEMEKIIDLHLLVSKTVTLEYIQREKISMIKFLKKGRVLYNPVDIDEFEQNKPSEQQILQFRREIGVDRHMPLICRVGRPDMAKWTSFPVNMMWFLARKIPEVRYLIVGGLPECIRKKIAKYRLEKNFIDFGVANEQELFKIYYSIDVLAHSSRIGESFGCTIAETMAAGKPVVVDSTPWLDNAQIELVENGVTGFIATTPKTFAEAVAYLLENRKDAEKMGRAGFEKAKKEFEAKRITRLLEKLYFELLASKGIAIDRGLLHQYMQLPYFPSNRALLAHPWEYQQRLANYFGHPSLIERFWFKLKQYTQARPRRAYIFKDRHLHVPTF